MYVDDHMTADLSWVEVIVPDFQKADHLVGDDMEDENVEGVVACIDKETLEPILSFIDPSADVEGHQESEDGWNGERQELVEGGAPVHIGCQILREEENDDAEEQCRPYVCIIVGHPSLPAVNILSEDESHAEEETAHHVTVAALNEINYLQPLPGLPTAEQQHDDTDKIGDSSFEEFGFTGKFGKLGDCGI